MVAWAVSVLSGPRATPVPRGCWDGRVPRFWESACSSLKCPVFREARPTWFEGEEHIPAAFTEALPSPETWAQNAVGLVTAATEAGGLALCFEERRPSRRSHAPGHGRR